MPDPALETLEVVPDWALQILQTVIRDYRYTGDYLPQSANDKIQIRIRRGDEPLGRIMLVHAMRGPKHILRLTFDGKDGAVQERFVALNLKSFQTSAMLLLERICRYGCSLDRNWCDACSQADRHTQRQFRGLSAPPAATGDEPNPPSP